MSEFDADMYEKALEVALPPRGKPSVAHLQHQLLVSWNKATAMLEQMVAEGRISTYGGRRVTAYTEGK